MSADPVDRAGGGAGGAVVVVDGVEHAVNGAQAAILQGGRILLQLRPWPPGWELPGGHCAAGEAPLEAAVREAREETGLEVRALRLVGVYRWEGLRHTADAVYLLEVVGGRPRRSLEGISHRFVRLSRYPRAVFPWIPQRLEDAFAAADGAPVVLRTQPITLRHVLFFGSTLLGTLIDGVRRLVSRWDAAAGP